MDVVMFSEFLKDYTEEFWDMCTKKYNIKVQASKTNVVLSDKKRLTESRNLADCYLDAEDDLVKYGIRNLDSKLLEELVELKGTLENDANRRVKAGILIPEKNEYKTRHVRTLEALVKKNDTKAIDNLLKQPWSWSVHKPDHPVVKDKAAEQSEKKGRSETKDRKRSREKSVEKRPTEKAKNRKLSRDEEKFLVQTKVLSDEEQEEETAVYVGGIPTHFDKRELKDELMKLFQPYGFICITKLYDRPVQNKISYAFVTVKSSKMAKEAIKELDGQTWHGVRLIVNSSFGSKPLPNPAISESVCSNVIKAIINKPDEKGYYAFTIDNDQDELKTREDVLSMLWSNQVKADIVNCKFSNGLVTLSCAKKSEIANAVRHLWHSSWKVNAVVEVQESRRLDNIGEGNRRNMVMELARDAKVDSKGWYTVSVSIYDKHQSMEEVKKYFREYGGMKRFSHIDRRAFIAYSTRQIVERVLMDHYRKDFDARIEKPVRPSLDDERGDKEDRHRKKRRSDDLDSSREDRYSRYSRTPERRHSKEREESSKNARRLEQLAEMLKNFELDGNDHATVSIMDEGQLLTEDTIKSMFKKFGEIKLVTVEGQYGYISFAKKIDAMQAIEAFWDTKLRIKVAHKRVWCTECNSKYHWTKICLERKRVETEKKKLKQLEKCISELKEKKKGFVVGVNKLGDFVSKQTVHNVFIKFGTIRSVQEAPHAFYVSFGEKSSAVAALESMVFNPAWDLFVSNTLPNFCAKCKMDGHKTRECIKEKTYCTACKNYGFHKGEACPIKKSCVICGKINCFEPLHMQISENMRKTLTQKTILTGAKGEEKTQEQLKENKGALGGIFSQYKSDISDDDDIADRSLSSESEIEDVVKGDRAAEEEILNLSKDSSGYWSVCVCPDPLYNIQKVDVLQKFLKYGKIKDIQNDSGKFTVKFKTKSRAKNAVREMWGTMWKVSVPYISPLELQHRTDKRKKLRALDRERKSPETRRKTKSRGRLRSSSDETTDDDSRSRSYDQDEAPWTRKKKKDRKEKRKKKSKSKWEEDSAESEDKHRGQHVNSKTFLHASLLARKGRRSRSPRKQRTSLERPNVYRERSYGSDSSGSISHSRSRIRSRSRTPDTRYGQATNSVHRSRTPDRRDADSRRMRWSRSRTPDRRYERADALPREAPRLPREEQGDVGMTEELYNLCEDYQGLWNISVVNNGRMRQLDVEEMFEQFGSVRSVNMTKKRIYIGYESDKSARMAMYSLWGTKWDCKVPSKQEIGFMQDKMWDRDRASNLPSTSSHRRRDSRERRPASRERYRQPSPVDERRRRPREEEFYRDAPGGRMSREGLGGDSADRGLRRPRSPSLDKEVSQEKKRKEDPVSVATVLKGIKEVLSTKVEEFVKMGSSGTDSTMVKELLDLMQEENENQPGQVNPPPKQAAAVKPDIPGLPASVASGFTAEQLKLWTMLNAQPGQATTSATSVQQAPQRAQQQPQSYAYNPPQQPAAAHYQQSAASATAAGYHQAGSYHPAVSPQQAVPPGWQFFQQAVSARGARPPAPRPQPPYMARPNFPPHGYYGH